jgi:hypothetical protein
MTKKERKEWEEILNEDGREITWMKGTWNRKDRIEKQRGGRFFLNFFLNIKSARVLEK